MDIQVLLSTDSAKVRRSPSLFAFYIETFVDIFGTKPSCAGCTFSKDFNKLKNHFNSLSNENNFVSLPTINKFSNMKTFKFRVPFNGILSYKKNGVMHRRYAYRADDAFIIEFLTYGSENELQERKKMFKVFPDGFGEKVSENASNEAEELVEEKPTESNVDTENINVVTDDNKDDDLTFEDSTENAEPIKETPPAPAKPAVKRTVKKKTTTRVKK